MKKLLMIIIVVAFSSCQADQSKTIKILENDGYTNIQLTGYDPFGCSENDDFSTGFVAYKGGRQVKGVVCSGLMKGATIRIY